MLFVLLLLFVIGLGINKKSYLHHRMLSYLKLQADIVRLSQLLRLVDAVLHCRRKDFLDC